MAGSKEQPRFDLKSLLGRRIVGLARVFYEYGGTFERDDGPLELTLENAIYLLNSEGDGERVRVREGPWLDPFDSPLSDENRRYVEEHGRWRRVDCSQHQPYAQMIDQIITAARFLFNATGNAAGIRISTPERDLWFVVEADECHIYWAQPLGFTEAVDR